MFLAPLLLAAQLASSAPSAPERHPLVTHAAIAAVVTAEFADLSTTEYVLGAAKGQEANPVFEPFASKGPIPAAIVKGAITVGVTYALLRAHKAHPLAATLAAVAIATATGAVAYHNSQLAK